MLRCVRCAVQWSVSERRCQCSSVRAMRGRCSCGSCRDCHYRCAPAIVNHDVICYYCNCCCCCCDYYCCCCCCCCECDGFACCRRREHLTINDDCPIDDRCDVHLAIDHDLFQLKNENIVLKILNVPKKKKPLSNINSPDCRRSTPPPPRPRRDPLN